jgi:hypothetical protein
MKGGKTMKREIIVKDIVFYIGNQTPRRNEYERGQKYRLFVGGRPTSYTFHTIKEAKTFIEKNYFIWM